MLDTVVEVYRASTLGERRRVDNAGQLLHSVNCVIFLLIFILPFVDLLYSQRDIWIR